MRRRVYAPCMQTPLSFAPSPFAPNRFGKKLLESCWETKRAAFGVETDPERTQAIRRVTHRSAALLSSRPFVVLARINVFVHGKRSPASDQMQLLDYSVLISLLVGISVYGIVKSRLTSQENGSRSLLVGSGASTFSVALSVCSGFISSISLLGFPAEVYSQGGMILWFAPMYALSFPIVAYIFLPVFYNLKLPTIYQYFERRFNYECRLAATVLFCIQILLYNSVALYAPSLAISSIIKIPLVLSIFVTAALSALYIGIGGAKAAIHTSALQMGLIFVALCFIITAGLRETSLAEVLETAHAGKRLILDDFRIDPTIRHSAWTLVLGGAGNILSLFAANQLSIQRYMAMDSLKSAQRVVMLNILCNTLILVLYVLLGLIIFSYYKGCYPANLNPNELLPQFVIDNVSSIPGSVGLFAAAVYSGGISTLSASFNALSSIIINDVLKVYRERTGKPPLSEETIAKASKLTRFPSLFALVQAGFSAILIAVVSIILAISCSFLQSIILQMAFIVFGAGGGPVLGSFIVGFFTRFVKGRAAFSGLITSIAICFSFAIGAVLLKSKPVPLPSYEHCFNSNAEDFDERSFGRVVLTQLPFGLESIFSISYQYYSVIGVVTNVITSIVVQLVSDFLSRKKVSTPVEEVLLSPFLQTQKPEELENDA
ncbi:unnamed protein product [Caenorhabditis auriculariae]|uniref:Sodium-dependent multivitamin transporter n=1 Tax=Caenorhabditis auriculariae TaxID=2777116 RepID=A0A8S1GPI6_9PELO|nr:unnamed protein product [Caenorhabditis auriculariae]